MTSGRKIAVTSGRESVVDEIRSLKEKLKGDGLSGNEHPQIKVLVEKLSGLKRFIVRAGDVA